MKHKENLVGVVLFLVVSCVLVGRADDTNNPCIPCWTTNIGKCPDFEIGSPTQTEYDCYVPSNWYTICASVITTTPGWVEVYDPCCQESGWTNTLSMSVTGWSWTVSGDATPSSGAGPCARFMPRSPGSYYAIFTACGTAGSEYPECDKCQSVRSADLILVKVEIESDPACGRDTDNIQVQYFTNVNHSGNFEYTANPLHIYYNIEPDTGWTPDSIQLKIKNPAGSVVRTIDLPPIRGEQETTWDGKNEAGEYVPFGKGYTAELEVKIGSTACTDEHAFDVYEIRQANCIYRPITWDEHAAIVYEYVGGNRLSDLQDASKYTVFEHPGQGHTTGISVLGNYDNWIGYYCPPGLTHEQRERILETAHTLDAANLPYVTPPSWDFFNALIHNSATDSPAGSDWAGTIADIDRIRCDGAVEAAYEDSGVRLYGGDAWWNIMQAGAESGGNLDRHNNGLDSLSPSKQRHGELTKNKVDALFFPQP